VSDSKNSMSAQALTVDNLATEFLRLIDEGWQPDLEEFLARVPDDQREECRNRIEELCSLNGVDLGAEFLISPAGLSEELHPSGGVERQCIREDLPHPQDSLLAQRVISR